MADPNNYLNPSYQPTAYGETPYSPGQTPLIQQILGNVGQAALPVVGGFADRAIHPWEHIKNTITGAPNTTNELLSYGDRPQDAPGAAQKSLGLALTAMPGYGGAVSREGVGIGGGKLLQRPDVKDFILGHARTGKTAQEITDLVNINYASELDNPVTRTQIYPKMREPVTPKASYLNTRGDKQRIEQGWNDLLGNNNPPPQSMPEPGNLEITPSQQAALDWMKREREPATLSSTTDYLNKMGVPFRVNRSPTDPSSMASPTDYIKMQDPNATESGLTQFHREKRSIPIPSARFPSDEHIGMSTSPMSVGSMFDTGTTPGFGAGSFNKMPTVRQYPGVLLNEEGVPFSNKKAMEEVLKWRFLRAPNNGNWLTSPQSAPLGKGYPKEPSPPKEEPTKQDPNQLLLKLLGDET